MTEKWWHSSGLAGLLFVVLALASAAVQGRGATYDLGGEAIAAWFAGNGSRYLVGQLISGLGFLLFYFPFLSGFIELLQSVEGSHPVWSRTAWAGGILFPAAGIAGGIFPVGLALVEGNVAADAAALAMAVSFYGLGVSGALSAILMGAAAVVILRTGVLPGWLGWTGAFLALLAVIGSAAIIENDPQGFLSAVNSIGWLGLFAWLLGVSVVLLRSGKASL